MEFGEVDVEGAIEAERRRDGADDLRNQLVEVRVAGSLHVQVALTQVEDGLVVDHEVAVGVLQSRVRRQDGVVRLHNSCRHLVIKTITLQPNKENTTIF